MIFVVIYLYLYYLVFKNKLWNFVFLEKGSFVGIKIFFIVYRIIIFLKLFLKCIEGLCLKVIWLFRIF